MTKTREMNIWGRTLNIPIVFDQYGEEIVLKEQEKSLNRFIEHTEWLDNAIKKVEAYCKSDVMNDVENNRKSNIFSYIKPDYLFIKRETAWPRVALMCKYRYDPEHGLAVVFDMAGSITVGLQDTIL